MRITRRIAGRLTRSERGQSIVEFALILPPMLLLFGATLDLGRIAAARITVENAAREGAFEASDDDATFDPTHAWLTTDPWNPATNPCDPETDAVTCRVLLESRDGAVVAIAPDDVQLTCDPSPCTPGLGNTATVTVTGTFTLLTPILQSFFGSSPDIAFGGSSTTQVETLPQPAPDEDVDPTPTPTPTPTPEASPTPTPSPSCGLPSAGFTYTTSPKGGRAPVTLTVTDTSTSGSLAYCQITSWTWNFGDGTILTGQSQPPHTYVTKGDYEVTLTVTSPGGKNTSGKVTITVR